MFTKLRQWVSCLSFRSLWFQRQKNPYQAEDETVQSDDVVLPHHVIQDLDALVQLLTARRRGKLVHQEIGKCPDVCDESSSADSLQNPAGTTTTSVKTFLNGGVFISTANRRTQNKQVANRNEIVLGGGKLIKGIRVQWEGESNTHTKKSQIKKWMF